MQNTIIKETQIKKVIFPEYQISFNRITDRLTSVFSPVEVKEYITLFERANKDPKKTQLDIEKFQEKHPDLPEIYNLLTFIYVKLRKIKKAEKLTKENYFKNPDYLFAKINYADLCLRKNKPQEVPKIFNHKFQLNELYPNRKIFHFSEVLGFMCLMSFYYLKINKKDIAKSYYDYAKLVDPDDATVLLLGRKIHKTNFIQKLIKLLSLKN